MKTFWTPKHDKRLLALWQAGRTATEIAKTLGCSRSAVLGRLYRQRHLAELIANPALAKPKKRKRKRRALGSDWQSALDRRSAQEQKDLVREDAAIKALGKALKSGTRRSEAIARANRAGASWRRLGEFFDRTPQWAYSYAQVWDRRFEIAKENRERAAGAQGAPARADRRHGQGGGARHARGAGDGARAPRRRHLAQHRRPFRHRPADRALPGPHLARAGPRRPHLQATEERNRV